MGSKATYLSTFLFLLFLSLTSYYVTGVEEPCERELEEINRLTKMYEAEHVMSSKCQSDFERYKKIADQLQSINEDKIRLLENEKSQTVRRYRQQTYFTKAIGYLLTKQYEEAKVICQGFDEETSLRFIQELDFLAELDIYNKNFDAIKEVIKANKR